MSKKRRAGEQADPFSRSLGALVPDARGAAIQLGQLEAAERAALQGADLDPDAMREALWADANAGREAQRALSARAGDVRAARGAMQDLTDLGYAWIRETRRRIRTVSLGTPPHGPPDAPALAALASLRAALKADRPRDAYVLADLDRALPLQEYVATLVGPAWTVTAPTHEGAPLQALLKAAVSAHKDARDVRSKASKAAEALRTSLRKNLWRLRSVWQDLGTRIRPLLWNECQPRARRARVSADVPGALAVASIAPASPLGEGNAPETAEPTPSALVTAENISVVVSVG